MTLTRSEPLRRTPIKRRSDRKRRAQAERGALVQQMIRDERGCEIGPWLYLAWLCWPDIGLPPGSGTPLLGGVRGCRGVIEGLHERRKRSASGSLDNPQNLVPACNACNGWVEDQPIIARLIGLVVRAGDPEWEELTA